jgi:hypothetical protein
MILRILLAVHAVVTAAAGVVLIAAPDAIPGAIGLSLAPGSYVLCYFLAAAELAIAFLSAYAAWCRQAESIRLAVLTIILFHAATAVLEIVALARGIGPGLWSNVALRVVAVVLFGYFGVIRQRPNKT